MYPLQNLNHGHALGHSIRCPWGRVYIGSKTMWTLKSTNSINQHQNFGPKKFAIGSKSQSMKEWKWCCCRTNSFPPNLGGAKSTQLEKLKFKLGSNLESKRKVHEQVYYIPSFFDLVPNLKPLSQYLILLCALPTPHTQVDLSISLLGFVTVGLVDNNKSHILSFQFWVSLLELRCKVIKSWSEIPVFFKWTHYPLNCLHYWTSNDWKFAFASS